MTRQMAEDSWTKQKIWTCFDIVNGATPASGIAHFWDGDVSWVGPADLGRLSSREIHRGARNLTRSGYESCGTTLVPKGTIILSARAPIGHVAVAGKGLCFNQGCKGLRLKPAVKYGFAYWLILSLKRRLEALGEGTTFVELSRSKLKDVDFLLPPPSEQHAIAAFLDDKCAKIDEAVRIKEEQIKLLRERKQILIQQAVTRGLNPDAPMKDSGIDWIGQVPAHWEVKRFKYLFEQSRLPTRLGDGIVTAFRDGQVTLRSNRRLDGYTEAILEGGYQGVRSGQLVLNSMDAFEGAIGVSESDGKCTPEYVICNPIGSGLSQYYFAYLLREMALARYIQVICNAVRQRAIRIRYNNLAHRFMVVPPHAEQLEIVEFIENTKTKIRDATSIKRDQINALTEYKTTLINAAVTGKIRITEDRL
ncbi:MAG: restriction endonuclease subunit S [Porticoccaceae bacterium]|nr:restriction endonuclease subunit S [Porticoccaceae bacterium]